MEKTEAKQIINRSGKILNLIDAEGKKLNELRNGDRIVRGESVDAYQKLKESEDNLYKDTRNFTKMYHDKNKELIEMVKEGKLSKQAVYFFYVLSCYVDFSGDNIVKKNGAGLRVEEIAELIGDSKRNTLRSLAELRKQKIIGTFKSEKETLTVLNPLYVNKGKINEMVLKLFKIDFSEFKEL